MTRYLGILAFAIWVYALIDILRSKFVDSTHKLIWILVVIFIPVLGAVLYLFIGKKQKLM